MLELLCRRTGNGAAASGLKSRFVTCAVHIGHVFNAGHIYFGNADNVLPLARRIQHHFD